MHAILARATLWRADVQGANAVVSSLRKPVALGAQPGDDAAGEEDLDLARGHPVPGGQLGAAGGVVDSHFIPPPLRRAAQ